MDHLFFVKGKDGIEERPLGFATDLPLKKVIDLITEFGGLPVYAHVDRKFGVIYQLGFIPNEENVRVIEVRKKETVNELRRKGYIVLTSSDAHSLYELGYRYSTIKDGIKDVAGILEEISNGRVNTLWD